MMSNSIVAAVYSGVIKDVIEKVKKDFQDNGIQEEVLGELERIWEHKIRSAKVAPWEANGILEDHNQNMSGSSTNVYPSHASDPNMKYQQLQNHEAAPPQQAATLPVRATATYIQNSQTNNDVANRPQGYIINSSGNPLAQASPSQSMIASPDISNRSNSVTPINSQTDASSAMSMISVDQKIYHHNNHQIMGVQQDVDYGNQLGERLIPRGTSGNSSPLPEFNTRVEPSYEDNDDINSDLDDPDDDDNNADSEDTQNIILCLYDKVTRTKNKWKCQLKDGIMSVNGRDYLFQKGNGDFEF